MIKSVLIGCVLGVFFGAGYVAGLVTAPKPEPLPANMRRVYYEGTRPKELLVCTDTNGALYCGDFADYFEIERGEEPGSGSLPTFEQPRTEFEL